MAICGSCGHESPRIRTIFHHSPDGKRLLSQEDECPHCKPGSFDPQWMTAKGAMGWEAYPTMYRKIEAPDGSVGYESTDEMRADTEERLARRNPDDVANEERKIAERKSFAASAPKKLTQAQIEAAARYWVPKLKEKAARDAESAAKYD
jgi:hypothetical protein